MLHSSSSLACSFIRIRGLNSKGGWESSEGAYQEVYPEPMDNMFQIHMALRRYTPNCYLKHMVKIFQFHKWATLMIILSTLLLPIEGQPVTAPAEVGALQAIKRSLNDPMNNLMSWNTGDPCMSNWSGIFCFNSTAEDGYLHVQELQLLNKNLSGVLAPELCQLSRVEILDFMWNKISGAIPKEIGYIVPLRLLLLNGNELSGSLPVEIGNLSNLDRIQIDQNKISGSLPTSLANLKKLKHFHMNNNSLSGQIPSEFSQLTNLLHLLLDNNNLTGFLPEELSVMPSLKILQLDNNNFSGASIPSSYGNMKKLLKLSLRNCNLQGVVPDLSRIPKLGYLDLSQNQLSGPIPTSKLAINITTIDFSNNMISGSIPSNFSGLPFLQKLSFENNMLNGSIPDALWKNITIGANRSLILNFKNNFLTSISHNLSLPTNVSLELQGNPVCAKANDISRLIYCGNQTLLQPRNSINTPTICQPQSCPYESFYEYNYADPISCFCAAPIRIGYRLKSPSFSDFGPYIVFFKEHLTTSLDMKLYQLDLDSYSWEEGPRLRMYLKLFPEYSSIFNSSELLRIRRMFSGWNIPLTDIFGPCELLNFTLLGPYKDVLPQEGISSKPSKGKVAGIIVGAVVMSAIVSFLIVWSKDRYHHIYKRHHLTKHQMKIGGLKDFTFEELSLATDKFSNSRLVGQGGYGKVYKGILADGNHVAIKRAEEGSLQGSKEFFTEIQLLSRLHHRNLVSLIGYCNEESEQMLVYEFMSNGTLRSHLSANSKETLGFSMRMCIALGSARGVLYLHKDANPPIFHRDIKSSNILLDSKFIAKVADFGLSRLAPVPDIEGFEPDHVSTMVKGTPGYLDPEYFLTHKLTDKSDVYSLGVVFLEMLTGMQPISHGKNIVREVKIAHQSGRMNSLIDPLMGPYPSECIERFMSLALRCCHCDPDERPSMTEVVRELEVIQQTASEAKLTSSISAVTDSKNEASASISMPNGYDLLSLEIEGSDTFSSSIPVVSPR